MLRIPTLFLFLFLAVTVHAAEPVIHRDLPYAEPKNERQSLDVYAPSTGTNHPVVLWIHGGGWQKGDKSTLALAKPEQGNLKPLAFTGDGCVFVAMNYRFIPTATLPEMMSDVAKAIAWIHRHAKEYGGNPDMIFVMGHSAGAQMAALVSTDERYLKAEGLSSQIIKGCVPVDGDSYYPALQIETSEPSRAASYRLKFPAGSDQELSSILHIASNKHIPPFLIVHLSDHPDSGTAIQSQMLANYLNNAKVPAKLVPVPGKTHETLNADLGLRDDMATAAIIRFVDEQKAASR
jgi:acetyl esterase/lipase